MATHRGRRRAGGGGQGRGRPRVRRRPGRRLRMARALWTTLLHRRVRDCRRCGWRSPQSPYSAARFRPGTGLVSRDVVEVATLQATRIADAGLTAPRKELRAPAALPFVLGEEETGPGVTRRADASCRRRAVPALLAASVAASVLAFAAAESRRRYQFSAPDHLRRRVARTAPPRTRTIRRTCGH